MTASPLAVELWSCQPAVGEECDGLRLCGSCVALRRGALTGCQGESGERPIDYRLRFHCWFKAGGPIMLLLHFQMGAERRNLWSIASDHIEREWLFVTAGAFVPMLKE